MKIALDALPPGFTVQVSGKRAEVSFGEDPEALTVIRVATDGTDLILFPDRSYKQADLAKLLGLGS